MSLMAYYRSGATAQGADKYHGPVAAGYDAKRTDDPKWTVEQKIIENMLSELPQRSWILDIPCGTGRFFECYARNNFTFWGVDKSADMLEQAAAKVINPGMAKLRVGDVRDLSWLENKSVDAAVMCRLTRWLSPDECIQAMFELMRVTRRRIIWTARVANHPHARTMELFATPLRESDWKITRNEAGYVTDYRILMAEPA